MNASDDRPSPVSAADHVRGARDALVTVIEYGDFECPSCKQAAPAVKLLLEKFPQRVRFVFRPFPLEGVHPHALAAAEAAECAGAQGKFWEMHDLLFGHQLHLTHQHLLAYAGELGLDLARFKGELDDEVYRQRVREHQKAGELSGVRGTPTFFINDRILDVSYGLHSLVDAIDSELRR